MAGIQFYSFWKSKTMRFYQILNYYRQKNHCFLILEAENNILLFLKARSIFLIILEARINSFIVVDSKSNTLEIF